jgi:hypothetical protein
MVIQINRLKKRLIKIKMSDLFLTMSGDLLINGNKDLSLVNSGAQNDVQQIYLRLMTEPGDFYVYPNLGTDLSILYGMPQSKETGDLGQRLIRAALEKENIFQGRNIEITSVPTSADSIRFDVHITTDTNEPIVLSVTQNL